MKELKEKERELRDGKERKGSEGTEKEGKGGGGNESLRKLVTLAWLRLVHPASTSLTPSLWLL